MSQRNSRSWLRRWFAPEKQAPRPRRRPRLEVLEDRLAPAINLTGVPSWVEQGPAPINMGGAVANPNNAVTGAIEAILEHPMANGRVFAGSVAGGVWRTNDITGGGNPANIAWVPITDGLESLYVGNMAFDPNNPETLYVATGSYSNTFRNQPGEGAVGIFRTTNASAATPTWEKLGGATFNASLNANGIAIRNLVISRANSNILLVAAADASGTGGLYRSINGGQTFTEISDGTILPFTGDATDIIADPNNANRFYAAAPNQGVFQSDDNGLTWNRIDNLNTAITGIAGSSNIEMAAHDAGATTVLYVGVVDGNQQLSGVFRYAQDGVDNNANGQVDDFTESTWAVIGAAPAIHVGMQGFNNFSIVADPGNPNFVYVGGDRPPQLFRGNAAAGTWTQIVSNASVTNTRPHADSRDLFFLRDGSLLESDDGGLFRLTNPGNPMNGMDAWTSAAGSAPNGLLATEIHALAYDTTANVIFAGFQDNGSAVQTAAIDQPAANRQTWNAFQGGDGQTQSYSAPANIRYSLQNNFGSFFRSNQAANIELRRPVGSAAELDGLENTSGGTTDFMFGTGPNFESRTPVAANRFLANNVMLGRRALYESTNQGDNITTVIAPTGLAGEKGATDRFRGLLYGGRRGGINFANVFYVGTDAGRLYVRDETGTINDRTAALSALATGGVQDIVVDPDDYRRVWVLIGNRIAFSTDAGATFTAANEVTSNLGTLTPFVRSLELVDTTPGTAGDGFLVAGGYGGVYRLLAPLPGTCPTTPQWTLFGLGIPHVIVQDMEFAQDDPDGNAGNGAGVLVAGTFGRGAWSISNASASIGVNGVLTVTGNAAANAMELRVDPANANRIIVDDGAGLVQSFEKALFERVEFRGLGGADSIRVDSNGGAGAGGTVNFVTFLLDADGGGDAGDTLIFEDISDNDATVSTFADASADTLTITATAIGNATDTFFGVCGLATYAGFQLGEVQIDLGSMGDTVNLLGSHAGAMIINGNGGGDTVNAGNAASSLDDIAGPVTFNGNAGTDRLNLNDQGDVTDNTYTLQANSVARTGGPTISFATLENLVLNGGTGTNTYNVNATGATISTTVNDGTGGATFTIAGDGLTGNNTFNGFGGGDNFTLNAGLGVTGTAVRLSGGTGTDVATFNGRAVDDAITETLTAITGGGNVTGLGQQVDFDTMERTDIDGQGGAANRFTFVDGTGMAFGTVLAPQTGIVYKPTGAAAGTITINTGLVLPVVNFRNINGPDGAFAINGSPNGAANARDVLTVLGASTNGLGSGPPFNELTTANGSDVITVSDTLVTLTNAAVGLLRSVALDQTAGNVTFTAMVLRAGNEAPPFGDTVTATPSNRLNLFLDGMDPACGKPGDKLTVLVAPNDRTVVFSTNPALGPPHARIVRISDGASVGFIHFETVAGVGIVAAGTGPGSTQVRTFDAVTNAPRLNFIAYPGFTGGVRVAVGDVNGDGIPDIVTGSGPGANGHVKVFDGISGALIASFFAFNGFTGGLYVSVADTNCDGRGDVIVGSGASATHVKVIDGTKLNQLLPNGQISDAALLGSFFAFAPLFAGGVTVAGGDFNGDGSSDVIVGAGPGAGPHVIVIDGKKFAQTQANGQIANTALLASFLAFGSDHGGGVFVAAGDVNGDFLADIIVGHGSGEQPEVAVYRGGNIALLAFFRVIDIGNLRDPVLPNTPTSVLQATGAIPFESGVRVAVADADGLGNSVQIIAVKGQSTIPRVRFYRAAPLAETKNYLAYDAAFAGGLFVGG